MIILGINAYADASAALLIDGRLVSAVEEERFNRIKHAAGFPSQAVRIIVEMQGLTTDHINDGQLYRKKDKKLTIGQ